MEVISNEITSVTVATSENTIPFNVNFDFLLAKYGHHGKYELFYKHNFSISLEDGTDYPAYILLFHNDSDEIGFRIGFMEIEKMKKADLNLEFQLTINEEIHMCDIG